MGRVKIEAPKAPRGEKNFAFFASKLHVCDAL